MIRCGLVWDAFSTYSILSTFSFHESLRELNPSSPEVLVTPTQEVGKILTALHATKLGGSIDLVTAIQVAQLALKHRQNKNLRQRIIAFVGSPLDDAVEEKSLVKLGKKLKKNNVALDIVNFGEHEVNEARLKALVDAVQSGENRYFRSAIMSLGAVSDQFLHSHFLTIVPGSHLMSDIILTSPVLRDPSEAAPPGAAPNEGFEFGFDPSLDPELAMVGLISFFLFFARAHSLTSNLQALRMSAEEEQARQRAVAAATGSRGEPSSAPAAAAAATVATGGARGAADAAMEGAEEDEEALLAQALAMSEQEAAGGDVEMGEEDISEEEEIERAIAMSMAPGDKGQNDNDDDEDMQPAR